MNSHLLSQIVRPFRIAQRIVAEDDYRYDPEHKRKPQGGGWQKTEKGWTKQKKENAPTVSSAAHVQRIADGLFSEAEMAAESPFNQCAGEADYYRQAEAAQHCMLDSLNSGREKEWIGASARHETALTEDGLMKPGPVLITAPIKSTKRAREKVAADYGGDWNKLCDGVRCSVAVDSFEELPDLIKNFREKTGCKIVGRVKNRLKKRAPCGYGDILCNVDFGNGFVGEVQFHVKPMLHAKEFEGGHKLYERERALKAKCGNNVESLSKEEQLELTENIADQRKLYDDAFATASKRVASAAKVARQDGQPKLTKYIMSDRLYTFYLYGDRDAVAFVKGNNWPMMWNGRDWVQVQSFLKFSENSVEITRKEFFAAAKKQHALIDL